MSEASWLRLKQDSSHQYWWSCTTNVAINQAELTRQMAFFPPEHPVFAQARPPCARNGCCPQEWQDRFAHGTCGAKSEVCMRVFVCRCVSRHAYMPIWCKYQGDHLPAAGLQISGTSAKLIRRRLASAWQKSAKKILKYDLYQTLWTSQTSSLSQCILQRLSSLPMSPALWMETCCETLHIFYNCFSTQVEERDVATVMFTISWQGCKKFQKNLYLI